MMHQDHDGQDEKPVPGALYPLLAGDDGLPGEELLEHVVPTVLDGRVEDEVYDLVDDPDVVQLLPDLGVAPGAMEHLVLGRAELVPEDTGVESGHDEDGLLVTLMILMMSLIT